MTKVIGLEVPVFNANNALQAQSWGVFRIELNASGTCGKGGVTPLVSELRRIGPELKVPVRVVIRPRDLPVTHDNFIYSDEEIELMKQCIMEFKAVGVMNPIRGDGFVFGVIEPRDGPRGDDAGVDVRRCRQLIHAAKPFGCTFHHAFDRLAASPNWARYMDELRICGFEGLLTAGGPGPCNDQLDRIEDICCYAGERLAVIIGGGVRNYNVEPLAERLAGMDAKCDLWVHSCSLTTIDGQVVEDIHCDAVQDLLSTFKLDHIGWESLYDHWRVPRRT